MAKKENSPLEEISQAVNIEQVATSENIQVDEIKKIQDPVIEKLRIELARLGLKIIEDIDNRRVSKPEETYNSLVALYNAVKN